MTTPKILGDVHLGKRFKNGVPLHRRGDRERLQWAEFEQHLMDCDGVELHVQVGDLFDEAVVPYWAIFRAAEKYRQAKIANPGTIYVVLRGNHDASRDVEKVSAFMLFKEMTRGVVMVVDECPVRCGDHVFIPWHPVITAAEMVEQHATTIEDAATAFGHWDVVMGGDNQIPSAELKALGIQRAVTGHDHNRREIELDGLPIFVTGSMQPFSHSEDAAERLYVTRSLADALSGDWTNHHLRVRLAAGETLDVPIDCLSLQVIREDQEEESVAIDVDFETFDFNNLLDQAVAQVGLRDTIATQVRERLQHERMGDGE